jgi:hypothetical protein
MVEYCDIYLLGVRQEGLGWSPDVDALLEDIANNLSDIERFNYVSVSVNMAQVYNFYLKVSSYDSMVIYFKGVRYKGKTIFNEIELLELEQKLFVYLSYVYGLTFQNIEIRCSKKFGFDEMELL